MRPRHSAPAAPRHALLNCNRGATARRERRVRTSWMLSLVALQVVSASPAPRAAGRRPPIRRPRRRTALPGVWRSWEARPQGSSPTRAATSSSTRRSAPTPGSSASRSAASRSSRSPTSTVTPAAGVRHLVGWLLGAARDERVDPHGAPRPAARARAVPQGMARVEHPRVGRLQHRRLRRASALPSATLAGWRSPSAWTSRGLAR